MYRNIYMYTYIIEDILFDAFVYPKLQNRTIYLDVLFQK